MARFAKTYAPNDYSHSDQQLKEKSSHNIRDWSITNDSLGNCRPTPIVHIPKAAGVKRKRKRWCPVTKMEHVLILVAIVLLITAVGVIIAWSIASNGFQVLVKDPGNIQDGCRTGVPTANNEKPLICTSAACAKLSVNFMENLDLSVKPCDDFYEFACGGFEKRYEIPHDKPYYNVIEIVSQKLLKMLRVLLEKQIESSDQLPVWTVKTFYQGCVNESSQDSNISALSKLLKEFGGWPVLDSRWTPMEEFSDDATSWELLTVELLKRHGKHVLLEITVVLDPVNTTRHILQFDQAHLGLENRMYYMNGVDNYLLKAYLLMMVETAVTLGANRTVAEHDMLEIIDLEIKLAEISSSEDSRRDPKRVYNRFKRTDLIHQFPKVNFASIFKSLYPLIAVDIDSVVVVEVDFLKQISDIFESTSARTMHNYLLWRLIQDYSHFLPMKFREPGYTFRGINLGTSARTPRWEECVSLTKVVFPMIVGSIYVREYFDEQSQQSVSEICRTLKSSFELGLTNLDWMDADTKLHAKAKAKNVRYHIGYPNWIFNNTKLLEPLHGITITRDNLLESVALIRGRRFAINMKRITQPMDPEHWFESPALVDAYYVPPRNEMVFPAGIIQFPFFLAGAPNYVTFATVGTVIAHEVMHGFDDEGRHYDKNGNLHNWWDTETEKLFKEKTECMEKQYGSVLVPEINKTLNGRLTLGENIADNVALKTAFNAFTLRSKVSGADAKLPGFENYTNEQMFFIAYANNWCSVNRPEYFDYLLYNDVHSPTRYRTTVPLQNFPEFSKAFQCERNSFMNPVDRCIIM